MQVGRGSKNDPAVLIDKGSMSFVRLRDYGGARSAVTERLMTTSKENLEQLEQSGYCVIDEVIPSSKVEMVRDNVLACLEAESESSEKMMAEIRAKGHRIAGAGILTVLGIINFDQSFAPYLTDARITGVVEASFGSHYRIAGTSAIANNPGNDRGYWHSDWPYNQTNAVRIPAPYADAMCKLSSLWMLTEFSPHTGGTLVVPGSHREPTNPSGGDGFDREAPHPQEIQICGAAGSVMLFDSRLWHCVATNHSGKPRVAISVGYAPWWMNLVPTREGSPEYTAMVVETGGKPNKTPLVPKSVYESLPDALRPLLRHWVA